MTATNQTGGIVGNNEGLVSEWTSECSINGTDELKTTMDIGGVDIWYITSLSMIDRMILLGIVVFGFKLSVNASIGENRFFARVITWWNCRTPEIEKSSTAFAMKGKSTDERCLGGIVGQAEAVYKSEYLDDKVNQVQDSGQFPQHDLKQHCFDHGDTSTAAKTYVDNLSEQYDNSSKTLSGISLGSSQIPSGESNPEAQQYMNNIRNSLWIK